MPSMNGLGMTKLQVGILEFASKSSGYENMNGITLTRGLNVHTEWFRSCKVGIEI